jgi:hypothetical protein
LSSMETSTIKCTSWRMGYTLITRQLWKRSLSHKVLNERQVDNYFTISNKKTLTFHLIV